MHARYIFRIRKSILSRYTCAPVRASSSLSLPRYGIMACGWHISSKSRAVTDEVMKTNVYQNGQTVKLPDCEESEHGKEERDKSGQIKFSLK